MRSTVVMLAVLVVSPVAASEPDRPLDCSDWVFLEPGLSCAEHAPLGSVSSNALWFQRGATAAIDNSGRVITLRFRLTDGGTYAYGLGKIEVVALIGSEERVLAYVEDRLNLSAVADHVRLPECGAGSCPVLPSISGQHVYFDALNGRVLIPLYDYCRGYPSGSSCPFYPEQRWVAAISGFATIFEILQTYSPPAALSFRVPAMPEGMRAADYFDTYYGDLTSVGDWSQVQGLACGFPATAPNVGDYLEVADTVPAPAPGQGYYYVTAAHFMGETRYGRSTTGGQLKGRDPAVLPACAAADMER